MRNIFLFVFLFSSQVLIGVAPEMVKSTKKPLRICELLPELLCSNLGVEPAVPSDFVAMSPSGDLSLSQPVYWGPKDVLEAYFKDQTSLKTPILRVILNPYVLQTGPDQFNGDDGDVKKTGKGLQGKGECEKLRWGDYPVRTQELIVQNQKFLVACVGLNDPQGWTLIFDLVYPIKPRHPTKKDRKLWDDFISKTRMLTGEDFLRSSQQDFYDGYTIAKVGSATVAVTAEKRKKDGKLQVVVIPQSDDISFDYEGLDECLMGAEWRYKSPLVKLYGVFTKKKSGENWVDVSGKVISVLIEEVDEFSVSREELAKRKNLYVFTGEEPKNKIFLEKLRGREDIL